MKGCRRLRFCFKGLVHKLTLCSNVKSAWIICGGIMLTNFRAFARVAWICGKSLWGQKHWQAQLFLCSFVVFSYVAAPLQVGTWNVYSPLTWLTLFALFCISLKSHTTKPTCASQRVSQTALDLTHMVASLGSYHSSYQEAPILS